MSNNKRIDLAGSIGNRDAASTKGRTSINAYPERSPRGSRVVKRPGLLPFQTGPDCTGQGIVFFADEVVTIACDSLYNGAVCGQYVQAFRPSISALELVLDATQFSGGAIPILPIGGTFNCISRYAVGVQKIDVNNPTLVYGTIGTYLVQLVNTMIPYDTGGYPTWSLVHNTEGTIPFIQTGSPSGFMGTYPSALLGTHAWNLYVSSTWTVTRVDATTYTATGPASVSGIGTGGVATAMKNATRLLYSPDTIGAGGNPIIYSTTFWVDGNLSCHVLEGDYFIDTQINMGTLIANNIVDSFCNL